MGPVAGFAPRRERVALGRFLAVQAGGILGLLFGVALAAFHTSQFLRVRHFLHVAMAVHALESTVRRSFQASGADAGGHTGLALPGLRTGIMASRTILATRRFRRLPLLPSQTRCQCQYDQG